MVTGGLLSVKERSLVQAVRKQVEAFRASSGAWLDVQYKVLAAEHLVASQRLRRSAAFRRAPYRAAVERFFTEDPTLDAPELTEVSLCTLLRDEGLGFEVATYAELYADPARRERLLGATDCVFASTTLLRDLSELEPMVRMLDRPWNRVVAGGALAGILHREWPGCPGLDVLAVGYGERLVPALAAWIRSGYQRLTPPDGGRLERAGATDVLHSGVPRSLSLDDLPEPDWRLAGAVHGRRFRMVHYESVRGCPYRCSFCNYPYLFDDTKFRTKSAARIAADWRALADDGAEYVTCLDSLFTMPKRRLVELCERLLADGTRLRWICYARADDLDDLDTVRLMKAAGCHQVQIGVESGSQRMLDHMNKRATVQAMRRGLLHCREAGLTTLVTVIVGFPGETPTTVRETVAFLRDAPPDFYYAAPFNTRVEYVPILSPDSRARFDLVTTTGGRSSAPYWRHATMASTEVGRWMRHIDDQMMHGGHALQGGLFYPGILTYDMADRPALLAFQRDVAASTPLVKATFGALRRFTQRRLDRDAARALALA